MTLLRRALIGVAVLALLAAGAAIHAALRRLLNPYDEAARILQGAASADTGALAQAARHQHRQWAMRTGRQLQARRELEALDGEL